MYLLILNAQSYESITDYYTFSLILGKSAAFLYISCTI